MIWKIRLAVAALVLSFGCSPSLCAQAAPTPAPKPSTGAIVSHPGWPQAKPADVDSIDHILAALYEVISGPAHQARDWSRMRSLFVPEARLIPVRVSAISPDGKPVAPVSDVIFLTIDDYIARASPRFEADGFFEHGVHNEIADFGDIVSVFSTYESRHSPADATPFARGINSIQLLKDTDRYWIVDVYWDAERPGLTIPPKYLPPSVGASGADAALTGNFLGDWTGQLEYRDYRTDERVSLPTWLNVQVYQNAHTIALNYTYDDGPTKVVHEQTTLTLEAQSRTATVISLDDHTTSVYSVDGLDEFSKRNRGTLTLQGKGTENNKPVDVRITVALGRNLLTWRKETRAAGTTDEFKFRDGYTLTRAEAPRI
jgi:hypothetical protein